MKRIHRSHVALALTIVIGLASLAIAAPKAERSSKLRIEGRVLQIDKNARTLLVSDQWSKKLYLVTVPKGTTFTITFGMNMKYAEPTFSDVNKNDRVRLRCTRNSGEHLSRLDDGREVVVLTAIN